MTPTCAVLALPHALSVTPLNGGLVSAVAAEAPARSTDDEEDKRK